jgi:hypothetical protein
VGGFLSKAKHRFTDTLRQKAMNSQGHNLMFPEIKKMIVRCKLRLIFCAESPQTQPFRPIQSLIFRA